MFAERGELDTAEQLLATRRRDLGRRADANTPSDLSLRLLRARGRPRGGPGRARGGVRGVAPRARDRSKSRSALVEVLEAALELGELGRVDEQLAFMAGLAAGEQAAFPQRPGSPLQGAARSAPGEVDRVEPGFRPRRPRFASSSSRSGWPSRCSNTASGSSSRRDRTRRSRCSPRRARSSSGSGETLARAARPSASGELQSAAAS